MDLAEPLSFDHQDRADVYDYVERHGQATRRELRRALDMDKRGLGHHVAILKRDGVLEEDADGLRVAYDETVAEEYTEEDLSFTIRQARQEDLTGLVGAIRASVGEKTYVDAETVADVVDSEGVLLRHNELESRIFFVATVDGEVVGWVHLKHPELAKLSHTAELTLGVLEEYRDHGIGSHLLQRGLEWAQTHGYERIYNSVPATNEAGIGFLLKHGFEREAVREDHYKLDGKYIDEVMLARTL